MTKSYFVVCKAKNGVWFRISVACYLKIKVGLSNIINKVVCFTNQFNILVALKHFDAESSSTLLNLLYFGDRLAKKLNATFCLPHIKSRYLTSVYKEHIFYYSCLVLINIQVGSHKKLTGKRNLMAVASHCCPMIHTPLGLGLICEWGGGSFCPLFCPPTMEGLPCMPACRGCSSSCCSFSLVWAADWCSCSGSSFSLPACPSACLPGSCSSSFLWKNVSIVSWELSICIKTLSI